MDGDREMVLKKAPLARKMLTGALVIPLLLTSMAFTSAAGMERESGLAKGVQLEYLDRG